MSPCGAGGDRGGHHGSDPAEAVPWGLLVPAVARLNLKAELVSSDPQSFLAKLRGQPEEEISPALEIAQQQRRMSQHEFCRNPDPREARSVKRAYII